MTAEDGASWVDLMFAMTSVLGSDDESIDLASDVLHAIAPLMERHWRDAALLAKVRAIVASVGIGDDDLPAHAAIGAIEDLLAGES